MGSIPGPSVEEAPMLKEEAGRDTVMALHISERDPVNLKKLLVFQMNQSDIQMNCFSTDTEAINGSYSCAHKGNKCVTTFYRESQIQSCKDIKHCVSTFQKTSSTQKSFRSLRANINTEET